MGMLSGLYGAQVNRLFVHNSKYTLRGAYVKCLYPSLTLNMLYIF